MSTDAPPPDQPGVARDPSSLPAILDDLATRGYDAALAPAGRDRPGAIRCGACSEVSDASRFGVEGMRRMEGASDPDEMMAIAVLRCPVCGAGGALVLTYGPEVTDVDTAILERLADPPPPPVPT